MIEDNEEKRMPDDHAKDAKREVYETLQRHLLCDERPSVYLSEARESREFRQQPFSMLGSLKATEQSPQHHPEGNVWNHTLLVVDYAARLKGQSRSPRALLWAALLHDIGKPGTTALRNGRITAYGHEELGARLAERFLNECACEASLVREVAALVRWHMQLLHVTQSTRFSAIPQMKAETDIREAALLGLCDRMGRTGASLREEQENVRRFLEKAGR